MLRHTTSNRARDCDGLFKALAWTFRYRENVPGGCKPRTGLSIGTPTSESTRATTNCCFSRGQCKLYRPASLAACYRSTGAYVSGRTIQAWTIETPTGDGIRRRRRSFRGRRVAGGCICCTVCRWSGTCNALKDNWSQRRTAFRACNIFVPSCRLVMKQPRYMRRSTPWVP